MAIAAGLLRHRVRIEEQVTSVNEDGEQSVDWVEVATVWACIEPLSAREFLTAQQVQSKVSARITMRYRAGIVASMRLIHRDTLYNIEGVLPDVVSGIEYLTLPVSSGPYFRETAGSSFLITDTGDSLVTDTGDILVTA